MKRLTVLAKGTAVALFWVLVWWIVAAALQKPLLFPTPLRVLITLWSLLGTAEFWLCAAVTLGRIAIGVLVAFAIGALLASLTVRFSMLDTLFAPLLSVVKSTPVSSFVLLLLIFIGRDVLPSIICALIVLPVVWANVSEGIKGTDKSLLEMARVFRFSKVKTIRTVYLPTVMPYVLSACRSSLGLAWKAGIAAEVLSVPGTSIGKHLFEAKLYFETEELFAWTLAVVVFSLLIEQVVIRAMGKLSFARSMQGVRP